MPGRNLDRLLEEVGSLTAAERDELRARLNGWPKPSQSTEDALDQRLLGAGVICSVPARGSTPSYRWRPIAVKGEPLSETIVKERR